jgi:phosphatidylglycerol---prolipoprotein diacylglyceryl transferase
MTLQTHSMLGIFASIIHHPVSYQIGPFQATGFGLAMLLAFVIGQIVVTKELERRGENTAPVGDMVFAAVIGGLLGAKLYYAVLMHDATALLSRSGFVFWGGLMGGIIAVVLVVMKKKLGVARMSDAIALALPAAYSIGRTGCWAVGDDYGRPYNGPLSVMFPEGAPPSTVGNMSKMFGVQFPAGMSPQQVVAVYPTQIFEVVMGFIMFLIVWRFRDHKHAVGWLFGFYCLLAGIERFIIEFFRAKDDRFFVGGLTSAQLIALGFAFFGAVWMYMRRNVTATAPGIYSKRATAR